MDNSPPFGSQDSPPTDDGDRRALDDLREALGADFDIIRPLGRGSMATVYLAKDRALGVMVAVKASWHRR